MPSPRSPRLSSQRQSPPPRRSSVSSSSLRGRRAWSGLRRSVPRGPPSDRPSPESFGEGDGGASPPPPLSFAMIDSGSPYLSRHTRRDLPPCRLLESLVPPNIKAFVGHHYASSSPSSAFHTRSPAAAFGPSALDGNHCKKGVAESGGHQK